MRFRGMDTDGDGIITRQEWRGNDVSFANHDWNGDGVLSGPEVAPGADRDRDDDDDDDGDFRDRFERLDVDRDGVVSRSEWRGHADAFTQLDVNGDGVLTRREFFRRVPRDRESIFRRWDRNGDGLLTRAEWRLDMDLFNRLDVDDDGTVSRREFLRG